MNFYTFSLILHSWVRWIVLLIALVVIIRALSGWFGKKDWTATDARWASRFVMIVSVQFIIGLVLLFISPGVQHAMAQGMAEVMKNGELRMLLVEHPIGMLIGVALVHIGKGRAAKAKTSLQSHKRAAIFFLIAVVIMLGSIPWGSSEMFRGF